MKIKDKVRDKYRKIQREKKMRQIYKGKIERGREGKRWINRKKNHISPPSLDVSNLVKLIVPIFGPLSGSP